VSALATLHLREMAMFALATGLRAANVTRLTWEQVDLSRNLAWVHPDQAKARRAIAVPLNDMATNVLRGKSASIGARVHVSGTAHQAGEHEGLVPRAQARRYRELQVSRPAPYLGQLARAEWYAALRVTGAGRLGTERMVRRYAHLAANHLAAYVANAQIHGTFLAQAPFTATENAR